jgi:hypothetical protein
MVKEIFPPIQYTLGICEHISIPVLCNINSRLVLYLNSFRSLYKSLIFFILLLVSSSLILTFGYSLFLFLNILLVSRLKFCRLSPLIWLELWNQIQTQNLILIDISVSLLKGGTQKFVWQFAHLATAGCAENSSLSCWRIMDKENSCSFNAWHKYQRVCQRETRVLPYQNLLQFLFHSHITVCDVIV